jgi:hypothetical protein
MRARCVDGCGGVVEAGQGASRLALGGDVAGEFKLRRAGKRSEMPSGVHRA